MAEFPVLAQQQAMMEARAVPPAAEEIETIIVTSARPRGSAKGDIIPETTFTSGDIQSFGVSSINELIGELTPQTDSGQGRGGESPVFLLSGQRISGFSEIRNIPTEAIQRVEILPEEVGLKYGYRPNQKVVNFVLQDRFNAFIGELDAALPTEGGQFSSEIESSYFSVADGRRLNVSLNYERSTALSENERAILAQPPRRPYDVLGNVGSATQDAEIDPALSAILGYPATVVGVPSSATSGRPSLLDFAPGTVNVSDVGRYRTLLPATDALTLNTVLSSGVFGNVSASLNASIAYSESDSAQGLGTAQLGLPSGSLYSPFGTDTRIYRYLPEFGALGQRNRDVTGHLGLTLNGALDGWQWTFTGNFDHANSRTSTDRGFDLSAVQAQLEALDPRLNPFAPLAFDQITGRLVDFARSNSTVGDGELVLTGPLLSLPAGTATATITVGGTTQDFRSRSVRTGVVAIADLARDQAGGQISIDLPIASARRDVLSPLGELSVNFNLGHDQLSQIGGLQTLGAGFTWTPIAPLRVITSWIEEEGAPTVQQLGNPLITTTGIRVFDYVQGETVDITRIAGGNPVLIADKRRVLKFGARLKPFTNTDLTLIANYTNSSVRNPIMSFPTASAVMEAAFPSRFTRDAAGRLLQIDSRPINFEREGKEQMRWGINFSKQLQSPRPTTDRDVQRSGNSQPAGQDTPGGVTQPGRRGMVRGRPGGPGGGTRLQLALYHTIHFRDEILTYAGGPALDLLNGDVVGSAGGQSRHQLRVQAGLMRRGLGVRLSGNWQSATTVNAGVGGRSLQFSDLATLNLRLFANLGQQQNVVRKWSFLSGTRLSFSVTNLFNSRLRVTDTNGDTPVSYQPGYLDPLGRSVQLGIRKLF